MMISPRKLVWIQIRSDISLVPRWGSDHGAISGIWSIKKNASRRHGIGWWNPLICGWSSNDLSTSSNPHWQEECDKKDSWDDAGSYDVLWPIGGKKWRYPATGNDRSKSQAGETYEQPTSQFVEAFSEGTLRSMGAPGPGTPEGTWIALRRNHAQKIGFGIPKWTKKRWLVEVEINHDE